MPYTDTVFTAAARRTLATCWGVEAGDAPDRLRGGEESAAFALGDRVVRLGPRWRSTGEAEWCHAVATHAATRVPEAVAPLPARGGTTVVRVEDRPMSVWPLVPGAWPDPTAAGVLGQAAALLARLHRALASLRPPPRPVPSLLEQGLDGSPPSTDPVFADPSLDRWLSEYHRTYHRRQPVHGDFYRGNTLTDGTALVAVLDWDEACVIAPEAEVASAAREWAGDDLPAMRSFLSAYAAAGGPAGLLEQETLVQFIRHRLRCEAVSFSLERDRGTVHDQDDLAYHERRIATFTALRP